MIVHVSTPLRPYAGQRATVHVFGAKYGETMPVPDRLLPGPRSRAIDRVCRVWAHTNSLAVGSPLSYPEQALPGAGEFHVACGLFGG